VDVAVIGKVRCVGGRARSALCHPYNRQPKEIVQPQERWDQGIKVALALFDTYVVLLHSHTQQPAPIEDAKGRLRSRNCILIGENTHRRYLRVSVDHPPDLSPPRPLLSFLSSCDRTSNMTVTFISLPCSLMAICLLDLPLDEVHVFQFLLAAI
jgi:hypothetical protein